MITPIPTSLFISDNYVDVCEYNDDAIWVQTFKCAQDLLLINKDVGMGLSMTSCLGICIFLFPFFFMKCIPTSPFQRNDFSTCSTYFFHLGQSTNKNEMYGQQPQRTQRTQVSYRIQRQSPSCKVGTRLAMVWSARTDDGARTRTLWRGRRAREGAHAQTARARIAAYV